MIYYRHQTRPAETPCKSLGEEAGLPHREWLGQGRISGVRDSTLSLYESPFLVGTDKPSPVSRGDIDSHDA